MEPYSEKRRWQNNENVYKWKGPYSQWDTGQRTGETISVYVLSVTAKCSGS